MEHEIIELLFSSEKQRAIEKLERLGLAKIVAPFCDPIVNNVHFLALVYEFKKAKELGILKEHSELSIKNNEKASQTSRKGEDWHNFIKEFMQIVVEILEEKPNTIS